MLNAWRRTAAGRYIVATMLATAGLLATIAFQPYLQRTVFVLAFLSVSLIAWLAGFGPALLGIAISVLGIDYYVIPPAGFQFAPVEIVSVTAYILVALLISWLHTSAVGHQRLADQRAALLEEQQQTLQQQTIELEQQMEEAQVLQEELSMLNTELTQAAERLERRGEFLEQAQRSAHLGSWEWEIATNEVTWSDEMFRVYGVEPGSIAVSFETFLGFVPPEDREMVQRAVQEAFERREPFAFDHRIVRPDGTIRWLHGKGHVVADDAGIPLRMIGSGQDITERRRIADEQARLYREAAAARAEAEAANRAKLDFLASMSHELRTPLNAIAGYVQLLEMEIHGSLTAQQRSHLERMRKAQVHLQGLVEQVLGFARIESGHLRFTMADFALRDALVEVHEIVEPQIVAKSLRFEILACPPGTTVHGDRERVEQILMNLVANAVKFTEPGGRVAISVEQAADFVTIHVMDTGRGIPAEKLEAIFEPFVQLLPRTDEARSGIGLGLAISRELSRAMGGDVAATSVVGDGSTFSLRLPAARGAPDASLTGQPEGSSAAAL